MIADESTAGWGHILADHFVLGDTPAKVRADETAVNLLVDDAVVSSTAGKESEALDWAAWDVRALRGKRARIQIVDASRGGWGHVLADHFTLADAPARPPSSARCWLDYGKDYYAAISFNDAPGGKRLMIGWMNNWQYANQVPTSPWRSAMSVPREVTLQTVDGKPRLVQTPVEAVAALRTGTPHTEAGPVVGRAHAGQARRRARHPRDLPSRHGDAVRPEGAGRRGDRLRRRGGDLVRQARRDAAELRRHAHGAGAAARRPAAAARARRPFARRGLRAGRRADDQRPGLRSRRRR